MSALAPFGLVDSEVTVGTICIFKQVSPKLEQLVVPLGLWAANIAPKASGEPATGCCCGFGERCSWRKQNPGQ